jgi:hypothetical protein
MHVHDCTFLGLHKWHNHLFEKLGWMAMAKHHHNGLKVKAYKESIHHLEQCLHDKLNNTECHDRKNDLKVLLVNTDCLQHCAKILLDEGKDGSSNEWNSNSPAHKATFHGLHKWMKCKYEKLGWMCLAKKHGHNLIVECYLDSIERLKSSLEQKHNELHEQDRKDDIKILIDDVCILHSAAHKLLSGRHSMHTSHHSKSHKKTQKRHST